MAQPKIDKKTLERLRDRLLATLARARAEDEDDEDPAALRRIRFAPTAAEDGLGRLPERILSREGERLQARFARSAEALGVTLEALGAPAVRSLREREGRLVSADGRTDRRFRFDLSGRARLSLSPAPEIEAGLTKGFDVEIDDEASL